MRSKGDISNKSGRRDANPFPSPPSHRSLLLSFLFSGACSPGNTRRHVKKTHEKDRIQLYHLALYRYLSSIQAIVLKNRARRFAYNNVHCIFEQWEDPPRPHRHFHPLCHLICAFFKGKTKLPARLLMVASGKRSSSFDPWSSVLFPPMDPAFDYSIFFFFFPLDTQFTDIVYYSSISRNVDSF